jgi:molecular chaperone GrpE
MSPRRVGVEPPEGWESLAEEASEGRLAPSPELEAALREAEAAVEQTEPARGAAPAPAAEAGPGSEELALELKATQDRLLRLQADFENFRRRALREKTEAHQYGHQNLVKDLLSAVDNLDRAIEHARQSAELEGLLQGVELVRRELLTALAKHGVTPIDAVGKPFDPALHEALSQVEDGSVAPNTVVQELQKGYQLRDRLLRPTRVVVARAPGQASQPEQTQDPGGASA